MMYDGIYMVYKKLNSHSLHDLYMYIHIRISNCCSKYNVHILAVCCLFNLTLYYMQWWQVGSSSLI